MKATKSSWAPKQMPRKGFPLSIANLAASTIPSTPLLPKPGVSSIPSAVSRRLRTLEESLSRSSASMNTLFTLAPSEAPAWLSASLMLM